jgi:selenocysteine-specific elongation factor
MQHMIVGTAGHIDHGKSALVKALTGVDPDRLKEEQLRGITIDLGFAHLQLNNAQIGFVDVPGHEKFVKNMLAGVGGIDCVMLVVAADESIMPQTREHFDICRLLGIPSGIVVISKIDLIEPELIELVREEIAEMTQGSFLEDAEVIPISARTGQGLDLLKAALYRSARNLPPRSLDHPLRLPIDRVFTMRGFGTVVTGTLAAGCIRRDEEVELIPGGLIARVRGIQVYGKAAEIAVAGQRTAVNLQGVELAQVSRGMSLAPPHLFRAERIVDVRLDLLSGARPLKNLTKVRFHQGTAEVPARVALLGSSCLEPGKSAWAQLRLDAPAFCLHGDAFIIRQFSPAATIGGGRIIHPHAEKHRTTDRRAPKLLQSLQEIDTARKVTGLIAMHPRRMMSLREVNAVFGLPEAAWQSIAAAAVAAGDLVLVPAAQPLLVQPVVLDDLKKETVALIARYHKENPLLRGISREELRKRYYDGLPAEVFRFCLEHLVEENEISLHEDLVALHGREVKLSPGEQRIRESVEKLLIQSDMQAPSAQDIAGLVAEDPAEVRKICHWMLKEKILLRIAEDLVYHQATLREMKHKIRERYARGSRFGVAEFKERFGLTRKHAIPLLEYLDREHITMRQGSERILL